MLRLIPPSVDHDGLAYVYYVYLHKSISRAAEVLGKDEDTVSRRVAAFEAHVGQPLFVRIPGGGCVPTTAADLLFMTVAVPAVEGLANFRQQAKAQSGPLVVIGTSAIPSYLAPLLRLVRAAHPRLMLRHVFAPRPELEDLLEQRKVHIALLSLDHPLPDTEWRTLLRRPVVFLVPAARGITDAETVWRELAGREPLVCAARGAAVRSRLDAELARRRRPWAVTLETNATIAIPSLTAAYGCVGVSVGVNQELEEAGLVSLVIDTIPPVYIGARYLTPVLPHVAALIETLAQAAVKFESLAKVVRAVRGAARRERK